MYIQVTESMFHDQFRAFNREENFSYEARSLLFDYLTEAEDNGANDGAGLELDIIGICCDFAEATIDAYLQDYRLLDHDSDLSELSETELKEFIENDISNNSIFVGWSTDDSFVYAQF